MSGKNKETKEAQLIIGGVVAVVIAWLVQPLAAVIAGIPTGAGQWGEALAQPNLVWGVTSRVPQFWVADATTWAALLSGAVAVWLLTKNSPMGGSDPFLVARHPAGGLGAIGLPMIGGGVGIAAVSVVGCGLLVSPLAGFVLGVPLAAGPILGFLAWLRGKDGREEIPGDRIILGAPKGDRRHWVAARPDMSVFMLGAPSSGKTGGVIIPNLLSWDGAAVSTSTKFDVATETIRRRSELGEVWVWAPLDEAKALPAGARRLNYSPISGAADWRVASRHAHALAFGTASGESSKVWASSASQLIACALHACAISDEGMSKVIDSVKQSDWRWLKKTLEGPGADPAAMTALASLEGRNQTFRADMGANIDQALSLVLSGNLVDGGEGEELDWTAFLEGRNTLYVVLPTELPHVDPAPYVNVLLADLVYAVRGVSAAHGYRLPYRLLMLLDELGALCSIDNLDNLIATQRAAGMSFLLAAQSLAQIDRRYGQGGTRTIRDAVGAIVLGMGVSDDQALHDMETLVGGGVSLQQQMGGRKKDDAPDVVEDQADRWAKHQIAAIKQYHFYVHLKGAGKPHHVKAPYFMDAPFRSLWAGEQTPEVTPSVANDIVAESDDGRLDLSVVTRTAGHLIQLITKASVLDQMANKWTGLVEDVWTRLTWPTLAAEMAGYALEMEQEATGIDLGRRGLGINVAGLNNWSPVFAGQTPVKQEFWEATSGGPKRLDNSTDEASGEKCQATSLGENSTLGASSLIRKDMKDDGYEIALEIEAEDDDEWGASEEGSGAGADDERTAGGDEVTEGDGGDRRWVRAERKVGEEEKWEPAVELELNAKSSRGRRAKVSEEGLIGTLPPLEVDPMDPEVVAAIDAVTAAGIADWEAKKSMEADLAGLEISPSVEEAGASSPPLATIPGEKPNRYAGACIVCGRKVAEKAGLTFKKVDRFVVRHPDCRLP